MDPQNEKLHRRRSRISPHASHIQIGKTSLAGNLSILHKTPLSNVLLLRHPSRTACVDQAWLRGGPPDQKRRTTLTIKTQTRWGLALGGRLVPRRRLLLSQRQRSKRTRGHRR